MRMVEQTRTFRAHAASLLRMMELVWTYLNYARQLYKLSRQQGISDGSFALSARVLLDKWAARGLGPAVPAAIRTQVIDAIAPTPQATSAFGLLALAS